jgi:Leucine-rich repeat (LRR) protein
VKCQALENVVLRESEGEKRNIPPLLNGPQNLTIEGFLDSDILDLSTKNVESTLKKTPSSSSIAEKAEDESTKADIEYLTFTIDPSLKIEDFKLDKYRHLAEEKDYDTLQSEFNENPDLVLAYFHQILYESNPYQLEFSLDEPKSAINILGFLGLQYGSIEVLRLFRDIVSNGDEVHPEIWKFAGQKMLPYLEDLKFNKYVPILSWDSLIGGVKHERLIEVITHKDWHEEKGGIGRILAHEDTQFRAIAYKFIIRTFPHQFAMFYCAIGLSDSDEEVKLTVEQELERRVGSGNTDALDFIKGLAEKPEMRKLSEDNMESLMSSAEEERSYELIADEPPRGVSTKKEEEKRGETVESIANLIDLEYGVNIPNEEKMFLIELGQVMYDYCPKEFLPNGSIIVVDSHIVKLRIINNQLTTLPDSIDQLTQLRELDLEGNQLTTLPTTIGQLSHLRFLILKNNQLSSLPDSIGELSELEGLYLANNRLTALPESFGQLSHLGYINLTNNQLTTLPKSFGQLGQLTHLKLQGNQLITLPDSIGKLSKLTELCLQRNHLRTLPSSIGQLTHLTQLELEENQLITLPDSIAKWNRLTELNLRRNLFTSLSDSIIQISHLRYLNLADNQLTTLPHSISQMSHIRNINLANNQLTSLPDSIGQLSHLAVLDLSNNQLTSLPDSIGELSDLERLNFAKNQLTTLPETVGQLTRLSEFKTSNNPFISLPKSIKQIPLLWAGSGSSRDYFFSLIKDNENE